MREAEKTGDLEGQAELKTSSSHTKVEGNTLKDFKDLWNGVVEAQFMNKFPFYHLLLKE